MFCTKCGAEIDPKAKFCWNCGAEILQPNEEESFKKSNLNELKDNNTTKTVEIKKDKKNNELNKKIKLKRLFVILLSLGGLTGLAAIPLYLFGIGGNWKVFEDNVQLYRYEWDLLELDEEFFDDSGGITYDTLYKEKILQIPSSVSVDCFSGKILDKDAAGGDIWYVPAYKGKQQFIKKVCSEKRISMQDFLKRKGFSSYKPFYVKNSTWELDQAFKEENDEITLDNNIFDLEKMKESKISINCTNKTYSLKNESGWSDWSNPKRTSSKNMLRDGCRSKGYSVSFDNPTKKERKSWFSAPRRRRQAPIFDYKQFNERDRLRRLENRIELDKINRQRGYGY